MEKSKHISKTQIIPESYIPSETITFCGNNISNYRFLINDKGFYPILIGQGEIPSIWIFSKTKKKGVIALVDDTVSNFDRIKVDIHKREKNITITDIVLKQIILNLNYNNQYILNQLNLNPLGYKIHGNDSGLIVGNTKVSGNTFSGVNSIIGL